MSHSTKPSSNNNNENTMHFNWVYIKKECNENVLNAFLCSQFYLYKRKRELGFLLFSLKKKELLSIKLNYNSIEKVQFEKVIAHYVRHFFLYFKLCQTYKAIFKISLGGLRSHSIMLWLIFVIRRIIIQ